MSISERAVGGVETHDIPLHKRDNSDVDVSGCLDISISNICQRCAKATKSPITYRSCCASKDGARDWCESIMIFRPNFQQQEIENNMNRMALRRRAWDILHDTRN
jgi:hypothetical protein